MTAAREEILGRVGAALATVGGREPAPSDQGPAYRRGSDRTRAELLDLLVERLQDYGTRVRRVPPAGIAAAIAEACGDRGSRRMVVPADAPAEWASRAFEMVIDADLPARELDLLDGVVTGCALAIAETGTIALDGGRHQGRRALTLVPDHHVCVVWRDQIVGLVPEAIDALRRAVAGEGRPVTLISGPSATSDIELRRVEGVHGPRKLDVILVTDAPGEPW